MSDPKIYLVPAVNVRSVNRLRSGDLTVAFDIDRRFATEVKDLMDLPDGIPFQLVLMEVHPDNEEQRMKQGSKKLSERQRIVWTITRVIEDELGWDDATKKAKFKKWFKVESRTDMTMEQLVECLKKVKDEAWELRKEQHNPDDNDDVESSDAKAE